MKWLRIELHWQLQIFADWLWDRRLLKAGNLACRIAARIYPHACKDDPKQWNSYL